VGYPITILFVRRKLTGWLLWQMTHD